MKVSVVLCTARDDHCLVDLPDVHLFTPTVVSLQKQTFRDFELIVVDALQSQREGFFRNVGFPVKHIPPKASPFASNGMWAVCNAMNTALLHAEGELIVKVDDASQFAPGYLQRIWNWYSIGLFPLSLVRYRRGGATVRFDDSARSYYLSQMGNAAEAEYGNLAKEKLDTLETLYGKGNAIDDSRLPYMKESFAVAPWNWVYGYVAAPLELFLDLNGYDEAFDGKKSLEDVDLGLRAYNMGHKDSFILEKGLWAEENFHSLVSERVVWSRARPAMCNYAILRLHENQKVTRANTRRFTSQELSFLKKESQKTPCSHSGGADYDLGEAFRFWAENVPVFDLKTMRRELAGGRAGGSTRVPGQREGS
ncbi:MAG: glycosyltransferase [Nitrososphaerota archaeon]|nr:glycosyltransferase [Nitrososphaerota archaeon]